jgi:hypothetical protein
MALRTGNVFMAAIKLKSGIVMIKMRWFPPVIIMTAGAGCDLAGIKLFVVNICVTISATHGEPRKPLLFHAVLIRLEMTLLTAGFGMPAGEFEGGGVMVELHLRPGGH